MVNFFNGLMQNYDNSSALAMEVLQSYIKSLIYKTFPHYVSFVLKNSTTGLGGFAAEKLRDA